MMHVIPPRYEGAKTWEELLPVALSLYKPQWRASEAKVLRELDKVRRESILDKLKLADEGATHVFFSCGGSNGVDEYDVKIDCQVYGRTIWCTCRADWSQGLCKHSMAAMLWSLPQAECEAALAMAAAAVWGGGGGAQVGAGTQSAPVHGHHAPAPPAPAPGRNLALERTFIGPRAMPRCLLMPLPPDPKKSAAKKAAAAPKTPAKKKAKTAAAPAQPPPKVYISGEAMIHTTDEELLAECRAVLGTEKPPLPSLSAAGPSSPPTPPAPAPPLAPVPPAPAAPAPEAPRRRKMLSDLI